MTDHAPAELIQTVLAPNAGPMTLDGTNSYLIGSGSGRVVVDPGPLDESHLAALCADGPVELILITHRHADHTEGAPRLHELTGAPVRAADPAYCVAAEPLRPNEKIVAAGVEIAVVGCPGHTDDSVSFHLPTSSAMLTGDTILGRGTTVIAHPDGDLASYFDTLDLLETFGPIAALPAHGPRLPDLGAVCQEYRAHRRMRLSQVQAALADLGLTGRADDEAAEAVVQAVYPETSGVIRSAALRSTRAQLEYLAAG